MKRTVALIVLVLISHVFTLSAQENKFKLGFAGQVVVPTGDFAKSEGGGAATGGGGIVSAEVAVSRQFTVGAEFAYNSFGEMKDDGVTSSATTTPILLRARAFLSPEGKFRPYLTGGIGFSDVSFDWDDGDESIGGSSSVFAFSLGVGAEAKVSENLFWDFRLTFNSAQTDGQNFDFDEFEVEPQFNSTYIGFTVGIKAGL